MLRVQQDVSQVRKSSAFRTDCVGIHWFSHRITPHLHFSERPVTLAVPILFTEVC